MNRGDPFAAPELRKSDSSLSRLLFSACRDLADGTITLVDRDVGVCVSVGVGVRDVNASERLTTDHAWALGIGPIQRFEQRIVLVGVTVRPSIDSDALNVASGVEASTGEHASELIADVALEHFEGCCHQFVASSAVLVLRWQSRLAGSAQKV